MSEPARLRDRRVVITGASRGIGAATAGRFARAGAHVTLVARRREVLEEVATPIGARVLVADVLDAQGVADRIADDGPVDVLVCNAGVVGVGAFLEQSTEELRAMEETNVLAPMLLSRLVLPAMVGRGRGRIVFVSSQSAHVSLPGLAAYSAGKAAVSRLAAGLRLELAGTGVGITVAEIGTTRTAVHDALLADPRTSSALARLRRLGLARVLDVDEVAAALVRACEEERDRVVLPRRSTASSVLADVPQTVADLALGRRGRPPARRVTAR